MFKKRRLYFLLHAFVTRRQRSCMKLWTTMELLGQQRWKTILFQISCILSRDIFFPWFGGSPKWKSFFSEKPWNHFGRYETWHSVHDLHIQFNVFSIRLACNVRMLDAKFVRVDRNFFSSHVLDLDDFYMFSSSEIFARNIQTVDELKIPSPNVENRI